MEIKYAVFDLDGTLVDTLFLWDDIWNKCGEKYLNRKTFYPSKEEDHIFRTLPLSETMNIIHERYQMGESGAELLDFVNGFIEEYYATSVQLKDGVREFLEFCYNNGTKMCVASASSQKLIDLALNHCGVEHCFLETLSCDLIGKGKERPDIFLKAQSVLEATIEEIWVFEDSVTALRTAKDLGMKRVGIYDRCNADQHSVKALSTVYIGKGETMGKLLEKGD